MDYTTEIINIVKIKEGFFIGDRIAGTTFEVIEQFKITHIINAAGNEIINQFESIGIKYLTLNWSESPKCILFNQNDEIASRIVNFVEDSYKNGEGLLVHSSRGQNRVCIVVIIYLIKKYNWTIQKCIDLLFSKKNDLFIPQYFLKQISDFENRISEISTIKKSFNWSDEQNKEDIDEFVMRNTYVNGLPIKIKNDNSIKKNKKRNLKVGWGDTNPYGKSNYLVDIDLQKDLFLMKDIKNVTAHLNLKPMKSCMKGYNKKKVIIQKEVIENNKNLKDINNDNEKENLNSNLNLDLDNNLFNNINEININNNNNNNINDDNNLLIQNPSINNYERKKDKNIIDNNDYSKGIGLDGKLLQEINNLTNNFNNLNLSKDNNENNFEKITFNNSIKPQKPINIINKVANDNFQNKIINNNLRIKSAQTKKNNSNSNENSLKRNSSFDKAPLNYSSKKGYVNLLNPNNNQRNNSLNNKEKNNKIIFANNYRQIVTNNVNNYFIQNSDFDNQRVRTPEQIRKNTNKKINNPFINFNPNKGQNKTNYFLNNNQKIKMMDYYSNNNNNNNYEYNNNILKNNYSDFQNRNVNNIPNKNQFLGFVSPINNYNPKKINLHTPMHNSNSQNSILNRNKPLNNFNPSLIRKAKTPIFNRPNNVNNGPIKIQNNDFYRKPSTPDQINSTLKKSKELEKLYKNNQNIYINLYHSISRSKSSTNNNTLKRPSTAPQKDKRNNNNNNYNHINFNFNNRNNIKNRNYLGGSLKRAPSPMIKSHHNHNNNLYKTQKLNNDKFNAGSTLVKSNSLSNDFFKKKY